MQDQLEGIPGTTSGLIVAAYFFTIEVWTGKGLRQFIVLFFIELSTRRAEIGGIAPVANGLWINQIARNLTDSEDGLLRGKRYLIHDRDPLFTEAFLSTLEETGVQSVRLPPRSSNLDAHAERLVGASKNVPRQIHPVGESSVRTAVQNFMVHYHRERNHQGLDNQLIEPEASQTPPRQALFNVGSVWVEC